MDDKTSGIDFWGQRVNMSVDDMYKSDSNISNIKVDTEESNLCSNNINLVSYNKNAVSGNLYQYYHLTRALGSLDVICDNRIISNKTKLCYSWKTSTNSSMTDFGEDGTRRQCLTFIRGDYLMVLILMSVLMVCY